jgi:hypothetical protein
MADLKGWVNNLGRYGQQYSVKDGRGNPIKGWGHQDYYWDGKTAPKKGSLYSDLGCTMTAITNILHWAVNGRNHPTPADTNANNDRFMSAMEKVYFICLVTGKRLSYGSNNSLIFDGGTHAPIDRSSSDYSSAIKKTGDAVMAGQPVLLSYTDCPGFLHSVVAAGVDRDDKIWIHDPYIASLHSDLTELETSANVPLCKKLYKAYKCVRS